MRSIELSVSTTSTTRILKGDAWDTTVSPPTFGDYAGGELWIETFNNPVYIVFNASSDTEADNALTNPATWDDGSHLGRYRLHPGYKLVLDLRKFTVKRIDMRAIGSTALVFVRFVYTGA